MRKTRADKGQKRDSYNSTARDRSDKGKVRSTYKTKSIEPRGITGKEYRVQISFWKNHSMDEIICLTPEELEAKINTFFEEYEKRQIKINSRWWYPEDPANDINKIRNKKTKSNSFNPKFN